MPEFSGSDTIAGERATDALATVSTTRETKFSTGLLDKASEFLNKALSRRSILKFGGVAAVAAGCAPRSTADSGGQGGGQPMPSPEASRAVVEQAHPHEYDPGPLDAKRFPKVETMEEMEALVTQLSHRMKWGVNSATPEGKAALRDLCRNNDSGNSFYTYFLEKNHAYMLNWKTNPDYRKRPTSYTYYNTDIELVNDATKLYSAHGFQFHGKFTSGVDTTTGINIGQEPQEVLDNLYTVELKNVNRPDGSEEQLWQITNIVPFGTVQ